MLYVTCGYISQLDTLHTSVYDKDTIVHIETAVLTHLLATIKTYTLLTVA